MPAGTIQDWTLHLRAAEPFQCSPRSCGEPVPVALGSSLQVDRAGPDAILSWDALAGAADYHVWQSGDPTFAAESFVGASGGATSLADTGAVAAPGSRYYLVRAANACSWEGP